MLRGVLVALLVFSGSVFAATSKVPSFTQKLFEAPSLERDSECKLILGSPPLQLDLPAGQSPIPELNRLALEAKTPQESYEARLILIDALLERGANTQAELLRRALPGAKKAKSEPVLDGDSLSIGKETGMGGVHSLYDAQGLLIGFRFVDHGFDRYGSPSDGGWTGEKKLLWFVKNGGAKAYKQWGLTHLEIAGDLSGLSAKGKAALLEIAAAAPLKSLKLAHFYKASQGLAGVLKGLAEIPHIRTGLRELTIQDSSSLGFDQVLRFVGLKRLRLEEVRRVRPGQFARLDALPEFETLELKDSLPNAPYEKEAWLTQIAQITKLKALVAYGDGYRGIGDLSEVEASQFLPLRDAPALKQLILGDFTVNLDSRLRPLSTLEVLGFSDCRIRGPMYQGMGPASVRRFLARPGLKIVIGEDP